jgi:hypothetical protein
MDRPPDPALEQFKAICESDEKLKPYFRKFLTAALTYIEIACETKLKRLNKERTVERDEFRSVTAWREYLTRCDELRRAYALARNGAFPFSAEGDCWKVLQLV